MKLLLKNNKKNSKITKDAWKYMLLVGGKKLAAAICTLIFT